MSGLDPQSFRDIVRLVEGWIFGHDTVDRATIRYQRLLHVLGCSVGGWCLGQEEISK